MKNLKDFTAAYAFSILLNVVVWIICLIPVPETPLDNVSMIDKWTHIVMFLTMTLVLLVEHIRHEKKAGLPALELRLSSMRFLFSYCWIIPSAMGGLIELAQAYLTNGVRSGDFRDFLADMLGAAVGVVIGIPVVRILSRA